MYIGFQLHEVIKFVLSRYCIPVGKELHLKITFILIMSMQLFPKNAMSGQNLDQFYNFMEMESVGMG